MFRKLKIECPNCNALWYWAHEDGVPRPAKCLFCGSTVDTEDVTGVTGLPYGRGPGTTLPSTSETPPDAVSIDLPRHENDNNPDGYRTWCGDCGRSSPTFATMLESRQWKCPECGNSKVAEEAAGGGGVMGSDEIICGHCHAILSGPTNQCEHCTPGAGLKKHRRVCTCGRTVVLLDARCGTCTCGVKFNYTGDKAAAAGIKHDDGKLQWDLIPWDALEPVVRVLMCGAEKYPSADNWRRVNDHRRRYINACLRHILATLRHDPEYLDPDDGEPHLAHAVCCLLFLLARDGR